MKSMTSVTEAHSMPSSRVGTVVFLPANSGSKSEAVVPFLYSNMNDVVRIMLKDDNPFENRGLQEYDGKRVAVSVRDGRGDVLIVEEITLV